MASASAPALSQGGPAEVTRQGGSGATLADASGGQTTGDARADSKQAPEPVSMILRIKRKRGTEPPDALYIEQQLSQGQPAGQAKDAGGTERDRDEFYALPRAKRRSLARLPASPSTDSLPGVSEVEVEKQDAKQPRPKTSGMPGFFRFAETLSFSLNSSTRSEDVELRKRVTKLQMLRRQELQQSTPEADGSHKGRTSPSPVAQPPTIRKVNVSGVAARSTSPASSSASTRSPSRSGSLKKTGSSSSLRTKADFIKKIQKSTRTAKKGEIVPGAVTAAQWKAQQEQRAQPGSVKKRGTRIIDIVVDSSSKGKSSPGKATGVDKKEGGKKRKGKSSAKDEVDSLGDVFRNMLVDHLKAKNAPLPEDLRTEEAQQQDSSSDEESSEDDDYVYDIYYREMPAAMPSRAAADGAAEVGLRPSQIIGAGTKADVFDEAAMDAESDSKAMSSLSSSGHMQPFLGIQGVQTIASLNVANLTQADWDELLQPTHSVPTSFDADGNPVTFGEWIEDEDELVDDEHVGTKFGKRLMDSDDSWDEGEDEDSNDEGFYRNDYPEQELSEDDEYGLGHEYRDSDGEHDEDDW